ncbi:zinc-binding metallopeptidase family protein [Methylobacterium sp. ID0610]|uniref:zinc-binding metallopeptidase family protein n=1 Tax=Methylobacterium carpenticola TaxID=3344827 RepID=UPI00367A67F8
MKIFQCQACEQPFHFETTRCASCERRAGYDPESGEVVTLSAGDGTLRAFAAPERRYRACANAAHAACNWLVPEDSAEIYCVACRHNRMVPDLSIPWNLTRWREIELAKRRLFYSLLRMRLPLALRRDDPEGLAFDFLVDPAEAQMIGPAVLTGHDNGLITVNLAEADDVERERRRTQFGEPYRTLLGHFRHEIGHYFWNVLVRHDPSLPAFRAIFGDERADYGSALQRYYAQGPGEAWQEHFVSAYATAHPWEDFAETFAHYLHIVDTLETAGSFGLRMQPKLRADLAATVDFDPHHAPDLERLIEAWLPLTFAMNSLNRSMGQPDLYPFRLTPTVIGKLSFVHERIHARDDAPGEVAATLKAVIASLRTPIAPPRSI